MPAAIINSKVLTNESRSNILGKFNIIMDAMLLVVVYLLKVAKSLLNQFGIVLRGKIQISDNWHTLLRSLVLDSGELY